VANLRHNFLIFVQKLRFAIQLPTETLTIQTAFLLFRKNSVIIIPEFVAVTIISTNTHSGVRRVCTVYCYVTLVAVVHVDEGRHSENVYLGTRGCARETESVPGRDNVAPRSLTHTCTSRLLRHLLGTRCIASVSHAEDLAG
jgi:hypothetical protein